MRIPAMFLGSVTVPIGLLFVFGIGALAANQYFENPTVWLWLGAGSLVVSGLLFFYIGFQAKVPIWLQLPILNSPRVYITKGDTEGPKKK